MPNTDEEKLWASFTTELGKAVFDQREARGMSQEALAYTAGISRSAVQKIERGVGRPGAASNPSLRTMLAIAQVLDVPIGALVPEIPILINRM